MGNCHVFLSSVDLLSPYMAVALFGVSIHGCEIVQINFLHCDSCVSSQLFFVLQSV